MITHRTKIAFVATAMALGLGTAGLSACSTGATPVTPASPAASVATSSAPAAPSSAATSNAAKPASSASSAGQATQPTATKTTPSATISANSVVFVQDCVTGNTLQKPKKFVLNCDGSKIELTNLTWSSWGGSSASASGRVAYWDQSEGPDLDWQARITVSNKRNLEATQQYGTVTITHVGNTPEGRATTKSYPLS